MRLRASVKWFAEEMEKRLRVNDHKGGWQGADQHQEQGFCARAHDAVESAKGWMHDLRCTPLDGGKQARGGTIQESVDAANYMMMVADNARNTKLRPAVKL